MNFLAKYEPPFLYINQKKKKNKQKKKKLIERKNYF